MTHPFHPLAGRQFAVADTRHAWGEERVYFYDEDGVLVRIPRAWTDRADLDPAVVVADGRADLRVDDLVRLVALLADLRQPDA